MMTNEQLSVLTAYANAGRTGASIMKIAVEYGLSESVVRRVARQFEQSGLLHQIGSEARPRFSLYCPHTQENRRWISSYGS